MIYLHISALLFVVCVMAVSDHDAFDWVRGKKPILESRHVHLYHRLVWAGLLTLIVTGAWMAYPLIGFLIHDTAFILKMLFVGILFVNGHLIGRLAHTSTTRTYASLSWSEKTPLLASGAISVVAWLSTATLAFFLF